LVGGGRDTKLKKVLFFEKVRQEGDQKLGGDFGGGRGAVGDGNRRIEGKKKRMGRKSS